MADIQNIVETIGGLSLLEASELVKALEDKFGVSAAAAAVAPVAVGAGAAAAPAVEEKDTFDVILTARRQQDQCYQGCPRADWSRTKGS